MSLLLATRAVQEISVSPAFDPDAEAFMIATGIPDDGTVYYSATPQEITGSEMWTAINVLVLAFKAAGIWTKCKAIYPLIGGTAFTHKWNLKDPRDLNAAYRLTYTGTITHSGTGMAPTGTANTHLNPFNTLTFASNHLSAYTRTDGTVGYDMGASDNAGLTLNEFILISRVSGNAYFSADGGYNCLITNADSKGYFMGTGSTPQDLYKNGSLIKSINSAGSQLAGNGNSATVGILSAIRETGIGVVNSDKQTAFNTIGDNLDATDSTNLYNAVQAYQTTLGREI